MLPFALNGEVWRVVVVNDYDLRLIDRTGEFRVATTDPRTHCIYISRSLKGEELEKVTIHEICHCLMFSYGLLPIVHKFVKEEYVIEAEEWICNLVANYGKEIFNAASIALNRPIRWRSKYD